MKRLNRTGAVTSSIRFIEYENKEFGIKISYPFGWDKKVYEEYIRFVAPVEIDSESFPKEIGVYYYPDVRRYFGDKSLNVDIL